jgi:hypothetical protein
VEILNSKTSFKFQNSQFNVKHKYVAYTEEAISDDVLIVIHTQQFQSEEIYVHPLRYGDSPMCTPCCITHGANI